MSLVWTDTAPLLAEGHQDTGVSGSHEHTSSPVREASAILSVTASQAEGTQSNASPSDCAPYQNGRERSHERRSDTPAQQNTTPTAKLGGGSGGGGDAPERREIPPATAHGSFARINHATRGWNTQYPDYWYARNEREGYTPEEIRMARVLGEARSEMRATLYQTRGDPAYGGGGYSIELIDEEIVKSASGRHLYPGHPYIEAARIIQPARAQRNQERGLIRKPHIELVLSPSDVVALTADAEEPIAW